MPSFLYEDHQDILSPYIKTRYFCFKGMLQVNQTSQLRGPEALAVTAVARSQI